MLLHHHFSALLCTLLISFSAFASEPFKVVTEDFPPYFGDNMQEKGWLWAAVKKALSDQGYDASIEFMPWARAVHLSKGGQYDALLGAFKTKEREAWYAFGQPISEVKSVFFVTLSNRDKIKWNGDLQTVASYKIAVGRGHVISDEFDKSTLLTKQEVPTLEDALSLLHLGKVDIAAGYGDVGLAELLNLEKKYKDISLTTTPIEPALASQNMYLAISLKTKDVESKTQRFDKAFQKLVSEGTVDSIKKRLFATPKSQ